MESERSCGQAVAPDRVGDSPGPVLTSVAVSATVVLYNSGAHLRECLRSLRPMLASGFAELIAVDNASPDDSAEIVRAEAPETRIVRSDRNRGFAGGCNLAWPYVEGHYWLLLNPDAVITQDSLMTLVDWMDTHPDVGAASPTLIDSTGRPCVAPRRFPSIRLSLMELTRLHRLLSSQRRAEVFLGPYWQGGDHVGADWVPGTVLIVRRRAAEAAGLLSEDYFMYGEDMEWCMRIRRAGWRIGFCSVAVALHYAASSATQTWSAKERERRSLRSYYQVYRSLKGTLACRLLVLVNTVAAAVEAVHPARSAAQRTESRIALQEHFAILFDRGR